MTSIHENRPLRGPHRFVWPTPSPRLYLVFPCPRDSPYFFRLPLCLLYTLGLMIKCAVCGCPFRKFHIHTTKNLFILTYSLDHSIGFFFYYSVGRIKENKSRTRLVEGRKINVMHGNIVVNTVDSSFIV